MTRSSWFLWSALSSIGVVAAAFGEGAAPQTVRIGEIVVGGELPSDLTRPEGRTRWDLSGLKTRSIEFRSLEAGTSSEALVERPSEGSSEVTVRATYTDASGGSDTAHWLHPERFTKDLVLGARSVIMVDEERDGKTDHLWIELEAVGIGWVHLPDGPHEAVLQRALILRGKADLAGYQPESLLHRWVAPQVGVIAEVWGPPSSDGKARETVGGASIVMDSPASVTSLTRMYEGELLAPVRTAIGYGWDRGPGPISELTSQGYATPNDLINASAWDFTAGPATRTIAGTTTANNSTTINGSGTAFQTDLRLHDKIALSSAPAVFATITNISSNTAITVSAPLGNGTTQTILRKKAEVSNTATPVNASETCNSARCGYTTPGAAMDRLDRYFDDPASLAKTNAVRERIETAGSDVTYYLRAGTQYEGLSGSLGVGEGRFCYSGAGRTNVPVWKFPHHDAQGYYVQPGDSWTSTPFNCEQNIFNGACATDTCGFLCQFWLKSGSGHTGTQGGTAIKAGVVTLPSGHTFNAMLFRTVADFCVYLTNSCGSCLSQVRTVVYLWEVPLLGTVAELDSAINAPDLTTFPSVAATIINFGLFPPRTIQSTGATGTTVSLSWDPGLDTHRITGYRIYWDTDSGASTTYAFNSTLNPGQVSFAGTSATVSGLNPGTTYYFTVTSLSTFTDPSSSVVTTYESLLYPTQVSGDPSFVYPIEVQAATTGGGCTPTTQVSGLMVHKQPGAIQISWSPVSDPCAVGYRVLGSNTPTPPASFSTVTDTGLVTSWTGATNLKFFLVKARGGNGNTGP